MDVVETAALLPDRSQRCLRVARWIQAQQKKFQWLSSEPVT
jgi:hypothetical protein